MPSHEQSVDLKPLSPHLKYSYLEEDQKLLVIIARELTSQQEEKLLHILRKNKNAIGWGVSHLALFFNVLKLDGHELTSSPLRVHPQGGTPQPLCCFSSSLHDKASDGDH